MFSPLLFFTSASATVFADTSEVSADDILKALYLSLDPETAWIEAVDMVRAAAVVLKMDPQGFACPPESNADDAVTERLAMFGELDTNTALLKYSEVDLLEMLAGEEEEMKEIVLYCAKILRMGCDEEPSNRRRGYYTCFASDSTVWVQTEGTVVPRQMEEIEPMDMVLSRRAETDELYFDRVFINLHSSKYSTDAMRTAELLKIEFEGGELEVTPGHLLPSGDELKPAGEFTVGDSILTASGLRTVTRVSSKMGKISSLMTSNSEYLVGAPGVSNHTFAAVGSNYIDSWVSRVPQRMLAEAGILEAWFLHLRSLNQGSDWHFHELLCDWMLEVMPEHVVGAILVTTVFLAAGILNWIGLLVQTAPGFVGFLSVAWLCRPSSLKKNKSGERRVCNRIF